MKKHTRYTGILRSCQFVLRLKLTFSIPHLLNNATLLYCRHYCHLIIDSLLRESLKYVADNAHREHR